MTRFTSRQTRKTDANSKIVEQFEEEEEEVEVPLNVMRGEGLCSGKTAINLLCMIWLWSATLIDYFVINIYLKYIPGSEYLNQTIAGISEILAHIVVGYMIAEITPKGTFMVGYLLASIGGACLMFQSHFGENVFLIAFFVLFAKFGASMAMGTCYISTPFLFPVKLCGTAFGICNLIGRTMALSASVIVELKIPLPM
jgi:nitrate/nitrite transporter NarK